LLAFLIPLPSLTFFGESRVFLLKPLWLASVCIGDVATVERSEAILTTAMKKHGCVDI
jgi:hypothetical protein